MQALITHVYMLQDEHITTRPHTTNHTTGFERHTHTHTHTPTLLGATFPPPLPHRSWSGGTRQQRTSWHQVLPCPHPLHHQHQHHTPWVSSYQLMSAHAPCAGRCWCFLQHQQQTPSKTNYSSQQNKHLETGSEARVLVGCLCKLWVAGASWQLWQHLSAVLSDAGFVTRLGCRE
jgi:hypothetical protein